MTYNRGCNAFEPFCFFCLFWHVCPNSNHKQLLTRYFGETFSQTNCFHAGEVFKEAMSGIKSNLLFYFIVFDIKLTCFRHIPILG